MKTYHTNYPLSVRDQALKDQHRVNRSSTIQAFLALVIIAIIFGLLVTLPYWVEIIIRLGG